MVLGHIKGLGQFGYLADGTPVTIPSSGVVNQGPQSNAQALVDGAIPAGQGGNAVQARGLEYVYQTTNIATLNPGAGTTNTIQYDNNSIFCWTRSTYTVDIAGAPQTNSSLVIPLVTLQITDTGNGMSFMNGPIPIPAIAGDARLPYVLPTPQFIQPNASYQFAFNSYEATGGGNVYNNLRFQQHGFRIFNK